MEHASSTLSITHTQRVLDLASQKGLLRASDLDAIGGRFAHVGQEPVLAGPDLGATLNPIVLPKELAWTRKQPFQRRS